MSIAQKLGYKEIPKERIKHFGEDDGKPIEATPFETVINEDNEEDRKILENTYNI